MSLILDEGVLFLLERLTMMPAGINLFLPAIELSGRIPQHFTDQKMLITAMAPIATPYTNGLTKQNKWDRYGSSRSAQVAVHPDLQMFDPRDGRYHYSFLYPASGTQVMQDNGQGCLVNDMLRMWKVSRHYKDYTAPLHFMLLEMMYDALLPGGYMAAVLPKGWLGGKMRYNKWFQERVGTVLKIQLPASALQRWMITNEDYWNEEQSGQTYTLEQLTKLSEVAQQAQLKPLSTGNWYLYVWHKTAKEVARSNELFYATRRYSTFSIRLLDLEEETILNVLTAFRKHDWFRYSIKPWLKLIGNQNSRTYYADASNWPIEIKSPGETRILKFSEKFKPTFQVFKNIEDLKQVPLAAHCKLGPPPKVYAYTPAAIVALQDLKARGPKHDGQPFSEEELKKGSDDYFPLETWTLRLRSRSFIENQEWLLKTLSDAGLTPCILEQDFQRLRKQQHWLDIQLTPIERVVRMPTPENGSHWELMYEDIGMRAIHPELVRMWEKRAERMKLDAKRYVMVDGKKEEHWRWNFPFQYEDEVTMACKQSIWNTDQMGLGKTREVLFFILLRGIEKSLIISPARLIGVWQDEIEKTIANYIRVTPRNWMRKMMSADYQVIEFARDCLPENLKTYNLISYENLSKVPKDALFFKCPVCEFVVCAPFGNYISAARTQLCPRCNHKKKTKVKGANPIYMIPQENQFSKMQEHTEQVSIINKETGTLSTVSVLKKELKKVHLKWTFANILRNRFTCRVAEESNYVNNPNANRSVANNHARARTRIALTGTPVRGYPRSVVNVLNWTFKPDVFPDYRSPGSGSRGASKFERKYGYFIEREGKSKKLLPKINEPEMFQQEMAPLMLRRVRTEPAVAKCIPPKVPEIINSIVEMDDEHRAYYSLWLEKFAEWWQLKRKEEDEQEEARLVNDLLVKLGYLINVSSIPHFMLDNLTGEGAMWASIIGPYKGKRVVSKFQRCTELVERNIGAKEKTIVFTWRTANIVLGRTWCKNHSPPLYSTFVDGSIPNKREARYGNRSEKDHRIDLFRHHDYHVLWAGTQSMKEGFNIPEANHGIFLEYTWEPSDWQQALARMLRPAQKKQVYGTFLCHRGTVDEYVAALAQLKARSAAEGVDHEDYSDFNIADIPSFVQYANSIVDGTNDDLRERMWSAVDELRKKLDEME